MIKWEYNKLSMEKSELDQGVGFEKEGSRNMGSWSQLENLVYVVFLDANKQAMASKRKRRSLRVFDQMAEFLGSRNSLQCRSHHQKLLEKYGETKLIIASYKKHVGREFYRHHFSMYAKEGQRPNLLLPPQTETNMECGEGDWVKVQDEAEGQPHPTVLCYYPFWQYALGGQGLPYGPIDSFGSPIVSSLP